MAEAAPIPNANDKEFNLYLNITNRCSNNCYFCFRRFRRGVGDFNLVLREEPSSDMVIKDMRNAINKKHWAEVVFCGFGEPLERLACLLEVTKWVKRYHGKTVRIDTNGQGYLLNKGRDVVKELKKVGIDGVSVSLNASDKKTYNEVCRPECEDAFDEILEFIEKAGEAGLGLEITALTVPEVDISKVKEIAERRGIGFRVRKYVPSF